MLLDLLLEITDAPPLETTTTGWFSRYATGERDRDGAPISIWFCNDCGHALETPAQGCPTCGLGEPEPGLTRPCGD